MIVAFIVYITIILIAELPAFTFNKGLCHLDNKIIKCSEIQLYAIVFSVIIISLILGLREGVGVDFYSYKYIYQHQTTIGAFKDVPEILFKTIYVLSSNIDLPFNGVLIVFNLISFSCLYASVKYLPGNRWIILFLFLSGQIFLYLNITRQGIAFFILLYAVRCYIQKAYIGYAMSIVIATGFHFSALLFLVIPILNQIRWIVQSRILLFSLLFCCVLFSKGILVLMLSSLGSLIEDTQYGRYGTLITDWEQTVGSGMGVIIRYISAMAILVYLPALRRYYNRIEVMNNNYWFESYFIIYFVGTILSAIFGNSLLLSRVSFLFVSFQFVIYGLFVYYLMGQGAREKSIGICFIFMYIGYFIGMVLLKNNGCSPYNFCFLS